MSNATTPAVSSRTTASGGLTYALGIVLLFSFAVLAFCWFKFLGPQETYDQKRGAARLTKLQTLRQDDQKALSGYSWVNKEKGVAHLPIDRSMELVASELKNASVAPSSVKVENPYPAGLAPAPAPAPALEATK